MLHYTATGYLILYQRRDAPILGLGFVQSPLFQTSEPGHYQCSMSGRQERTDWTVRVSISPETYVNCITLVLHTTDFGPSELRQQPDLWRKYNKSHIETICINLLVSDNNSDYANILGK